MDDMSDEVIIRCISDLNECNLVEVVYMFKC